MKNLIGLIVTLAVVGATPLNNYGFMPKFGLEVCLKEQSKNVIVSPASVYAALGLAYLGAEGATATEMQKVLQFDGKTKEEVAQAYGEFMKKFDVQEHSDTLHFDIANRVFVNDQFQISPTYDSLASMYFKSTAEKTNFADSVSAASKINNWVSEHTNHRINDILDSSLVDGSTSAVLVNAIFFKAQWQHQFRKDSTEQKDFFMSETEKKPINMMFQKHDFQYAILEDLDATAIKLPYKNTNIYMLVILPNQIDGLKRLKEKLMVSDMAALDNKFSYEKVNLHLPKFKFDYEISLNDILKEMGLSSMFENGDFGSMFTNKKNISIDNVIHKAFIEVDEYGTEASAATVVSTFRQGLARIIIPQKVYEFNVNHPFMFAIKDRETVYFAGHISF